MSRKTSLAIIVPCYNEQESIKYFEKELIAFVHYSKLHRPEINIEFLIINNNSTDNSKKLLLELSQKQTGSIRILDYSVQGYGAALKHGFKMAVLSDVPPQYLAFLDLDNTYPLSDLYKMLDQLIQQDLDLIYGARIHANSNISVVRSLGNRLYVGLLKLCFNSNLSDVCSGMRIFSPHKVDQILKLRANDLSFSIEFTVHAVLNNWKIGETSIAYRDRIGDSKLSLFKDGFTFLWVILKKAFFKNKYV